MIRCRTCVMPSTRPDTQFIDGECTACISYRKRASIDWTAREQELRSILATAKPNGSGYNCIAASSGGKDSHWITLKLIELGARPLVVTATTCMLTEIGRHNIDNLGRYATTIEITPNRTIRRKLNRFGLELVGDISWPEHVAIFTTPFRVARDLGMPLVFYGECPQEAYGGPQGTEEAQTLTRRWRSEFGGFLGLRPADLVGKDGLAREDLAEYEFPAENEIEGVTAYFLGQFCEWDSHRNATVAGGHGLRCERSSPSNWWSAENLDNAMTGVHDYFMWLKYGYGRGCAQISVDVRANVVSRQFALDWVASHDGLYPHAYAGVELREILKEIDMTQAEFTAIVDRFTNKAIHTEARPCSPIA